MVKCSIDRTFQLKLEQSCDLVNYMISSQDSDKFCLFISNFTTENRAQCCDCPSVEVRLVIVTLVMRDKTGVMADTELGRSKRKKNSLLSLFSSLYRLLQTANVVSTESIHMKVCHSVPI